jgi:hypothetical protein
MLATRDLISYGKFARCAGSCAAQGAGASGRREVTGKKELPDYLNLSDEDRAPSETRRNEELWEQQVRNLISHRVAEGNIVAEGLAEYKPGCLRITEAGRLHLKHAKNIQK